MPWVKLDDAFCWNEKVTEAGNEAAGIYARALAYCGAQLTDGRISSKAATLISEGRRKPVEALVKQGLWRRVDGGFEIPDYLDFNPSKEQVLKRRADRAAAGRSGGKASGQSRREAKDEASASAGASVVALHADEPPSRPVPGEVVLQS